MRRYTNTGVKMQVKKIINKYLPLLAILCLIAIWEASVKLSNTPDYILPAPSSVVKVFISTWNLLLQHTWVTIFEALSGFCISIAGGLVLAFVMDRWNTLKRILYPIMVISQTIPIIALAPVILVWLGVGIEPKIVIVVLVCFFPICVNTAEGLHSVDKDMVNLMKVMGAGDLRIFKDVSLPSALPHFFSGLKISATYSVMGAVIGEWLGAKSGLGIFMTRTINSHRMDMLFAAVVIVVILSIGLFKVIEIAERFSTPWNLKKSGKEENI
jgi:ABC-type nitrate/sulfonate/bicarbonate transport system permease component